MVKKLKRLLAPRFWKVPKKVKKWVVSPRPGPHKKFECIPLQIVVRDILKLAETGKEAKEIIKKGEILKEAKKKISRINNKTVIKKGKLQLNLHDGKSLLVEKDIYKTGDSVLIELPSQKIISHIKLEKGNVVLITKGKNAGNIGKIEGTLQKRSLADPNKVACKIDNKKFEILKEFVFPVGKDKPMIKLSE